MKKTKTKKPARMKETEAENAFKAAGRGSSRKYPPRLVAKLIREKLGFITKVADALECDPRTVKRYIEKYPICQQAYDETLEGALDAAEFKLREHIQNGTLAAITYYLDRKGKSRGYVPRQEITGKDGEALVPFDHIRVSIVEPRTAEQDAEPNA